MMQKTIQLALNEFPTVPASLRQAPRGNTAKADIDVDLARLYHHYYLDSFGAAPPNPDPAQFEHISLLMPTLEFRVKGEGFGIPTTIKRHRSNELGQAFCRWFLYEHLRITYFAHMERVLNRELHRGFGGRRIERVASGDAPDYFCARDVQRVYLAEAKGRMSAVRFSSPEFSQWRKQFDRVITRDAAGQPRSLKGYIVATRFATEQNRSSLKSKLFVEDPRTPGDAVLEDSGHIGSATVAVHYSGIAAKLRQPILESVLATGTTAPSEIRFPAAVWVFQIPPLQGRRFVGGYFPSKEGTKAIEMTEDQLQFRAADRLRLDVGSGTFFGLEENVFERLVSAARLGEAGMADIPILPEIEPFYSGISYLRDGTLLSPIDFVRPVELVSF